MEKSPLSRDTAPRPSKAYAAPPRSPRARQRSRTSVYTFSSLIQLAAFLHYQPETEGGEAMTERSPDSAGQLQALLGQVESVVVTA